MKLYAYEHCPYCIRVLTYMGVTHQLCDIKIVAADDCATPTGMVGQKTGPILEIEAGQYIAESVAVIDYLDSKADPEKKLMRPQSSEVIEWISVSLPIIYRLCLPRWVQMPFSEFQSSKARDYFINSTTNSIGPIQQALDLTERYCDKLAAKMELLEPMLGQHFIHGRFSTDDIYLFAALHGLTGVKDIAIPEHTQSYIEFMSEQSGVNLLSEYAI